MLNSERNLQKWDYQQVLTDNEATSENLRKSNTPAGTVKIK